MASDPIYRRPVELLQRLVRFDTTNPPGNERECIHYLDGLLRAAGFETTMLARVPERPSLITRLRGAGHAPALMLYGHVDVVTTANQAWTHPPFAGKVVDGEVWGRGALDMKGAVAMMVSALLRAKAEGLTPPGDIVLAVLADEEHGAHYGARYLVETYPEHFAGIRYALGELGGFAIYFAGQKFYPIQLQEKQVCRIRVTLRGPGGHGSLPMRGGAMARLARLLAALDRQRLPVHIVPVVREFFRQMADALPAPEVEMPRRLLDPAHTDAVLDRLGPDGRMFDAMLHNTVNATVVSASKKINVIPSEVTVKLDGRLLPGFGPEDMMRELRGVIGEDVEMKLIRYDPGPAQADMGLYDLLAGVLRDADPTGTPLPFLLPASTDARFFARLGIQTYGFMPMDLPEGINPLQFAHAANERIPVHALEFGAAAMYEVLRRYSAP